MVYHEHDHNLLLSLSPAEKIVIPQFPSTQDDPPTKHRSLTGAIVGGVVGGVALILLFVSIALYRKKRRSKKETPHVEAFVDSPNLTTYTPFTLKPEKSNTNPRMTSRRELLYPLRIPEKAREAAGTNQTLVHTPTPASVIVNQNASAATIQDSSIEPPTVAASATSRSTRRSNRTGQSGRHGRSARSQGSSSSSGSTLSTREVRGLRAELESLRRMMQSFREVDREWGPPSYAS